MKKFLTKIVALSLILFSIILIGILLPYPRQNFYNSILDNHQMLKEVDQPRIILVGGSNVCFGINSQLLSNSLKYNVINAATSVGPGLKYIVDDIVPYLKENDVVVLIPEYHFFYGKLLYGYKDMIYVLKSTKEEHPTLSYRQYRNLVSSAPKMSIINTKQFFFKKLGIKKRNKGLLDSEEKLFNEYGDFTYHWNLPKPDKFDVIPINPKYNPETIRVITKFNKTVEDKKAKLIIVYPTLNRSSLLVEKEKIRRIQKELLKTNLKIIGTPKRYSLADSLYFNTMYHLSKTGVDIRSNLLIEDLKKAGISN